MYYPLKSFKKKSEVGRYKVWLRQAIFDLEASKLSHMHGYNEWASYQATQSAEKVLKSHVAHSGWHPPRTHKLAVLVGISNSVNVQFRSKKFGFRHLEIFTYIARYPFLLPGEKSSPHDFVTKEDAEKCILEATGIIKVVNELLDEPGLGKFEDIEDLGSMNLSKRLDFVTKKIIKCLDPQKIILFGSYARGANKLSTLDIIVIAETELSFVERIKEIRECTKGGHPVVSPLVYTPDEFQLMLDGGEGFLENAISEGKVLYSK